MTDEDQSEDELPQPRLGDGQMENDLVVGCCGGKRLVKGLLGLGGLLVDELAADVMFFGDVADRLLARQRVDGQTLALLGSQ